MVESRFDASIASRYARLWPGLFDPAVLDPAVEFLADLAGDGPVLEFGVGTGRVAHPLARRGLRVHGIELSQAMVDELIRHGSTVEVKVGDFASATVDGTFSLVYLVRNTITNLTSVDEQVEAFLNAAAHLEPGGCFVVENYVPTLQRLPPGETTRVLAASTDHVALEDYDFENQIAISRHWWVIEGRLIAFESPHRYVWPSELDLMARLAGLCLRERWSDWQRNPFDAQSRSHVSVWEKPAGA